MHKEKTHSKSKIYKNTIGGGCCKIIHGYETYLKERLDEIEQEAKINKIKLIAKIYTDSFPNMQTFIKRNFTTNEYMWHDINMCNLELKSLLLYSDSKSIHDLNMFTEQFVIAFDKLLSQIDNNDMINEIRFAYKNMYSINNDIYIAYIDVNNLYNKVAIYTSIVEKLRNINHNRELRNRNYDKEYNSILKQFMQIGRDIYSLKNDKIYSMEQEKVLVTTNNIKKKIKTYWEFACKISKNLDNIFISQVALLNTHV